MFNKSKACGKKRTIKDDFRRSFVHVRPDPETLPPTSRPSIKDVHLHFRQVREDAKKQKLLGKK
jgi:hypothetical protein